MVHRFPMLHKSHSPARHIDDHENEHIGTLTSTPAHLFYPRLTWSTSPLNSPSGRMHKPLGTVERASRQESGHLDSRHNPFVLDLWPSMRMWEQREAASFGESNVA